MFDNFITQLRTNPRLRWGLALIVGIFWLYALLLMRDSLQEQTQQHRTTAQSVARLRAQLAQPEWTARVTPAKVMAVQLEGKLWQAPTPGLAQAAFQDWLNTTLMKAGVSKPQITVTVLEDAPPNAPTQSKDASTSATSGTAPRAPSDLWKIKAKLGFDAPAAVLMTFLNSIEDHEKQIIVGALNVRKEPTPHAEMELFGYFQKHTAPATKPNKEMVPQ
jgi:hypothetical protein